MQNSHSLIWIRTDLRVEDNQALYYACKNNFVTAIYLLFPESWQQQNDSPNKLYFWLQNLKLLEQELQQLNINLLVINAKSYKNAPQIIVNSAKKLNCNSIWFNNDYGYYEQQRDDLTAYECAKNNLECYRYLTHTIIEPGKLTTNQGKYFQVFTPFKRKFYAFITESMLVPLPKPKKRQPQKQLLASVEYTKMYKPTAINLDNNWPAGKKTAHKKLTSFIESGICNYDKTRDTPAISGTSMLSAYLNVGVISVRQCFYAVFLANQGKLETTNIGIQTWMNELVWREFYKHILVCFPQVSKFRAFKAKTNKIIWQNNAKFITAWQQGKTGYPIIDAAMQQLVTTGWMHNRLRMITAMFLTKNLMVDWRIGEKFFMQHLIDGDLAANNGGWQWCASTGADATPYFRVFNPVLQSLKFDPQGAFIRYWLPALATVSNKDVHFPHNSSATNNTNYIKPIVDYKSSKEKMISIFKAL